MIARSLFCFVVLFSSPTLNHIFRLYLYSYNIINTIIVIVITTMYQDKRICFFIFIFLYREFYFCSDENNNCN